MGTPLTSSMDKSIPSYDLIIVGGACAGLAAATYASRRAMKTLVLTMDIGGQIATTPTVENYPGIDFIGGPELAAAMQAQALKWGAEIVFDKVSSIEKRGEQDFLIASAQGSYQAKAIVLAYGKTPRMMEIPGEALYAGHGVSYCVTCDAPLYKKRTVAVVGGGSSAMEGALILAKVCEKVYLVHRRDQFRGEEILLEHINETPNIEKVLSVKPYEVLGDGKYLTGFRVASVTDGTTKDIALDGLFVEIGFLVNSELIKDLVELDKLNQVVTNVRQETSTPGVFAAGDLTDTPFKQAVISASEGAKAALQAYSYINEGKPVGVDWH